ncbi:MAG: hypothetical protein H7249_20695 [Chitinophagaceae bacterium]|nr:hypothetical protein [Oligoflexus sp.]
MDSRKVIKFANLKIEIVQAPGAAHYIIAGDVDENFRQKEIPRLRTPELHLHLKDVGNFNSVGIREWIQLIADLSQHSKLSFHECSVSSIDQINMVPHSLGGGTVESFYAPYYCECGQETVKLINVHDHEQELRRNEAPHFLCEHCGKSLEFDALEETYFQFLTSLPKAG